MKTRFKVLLPLLLALPAVVEAQFNYTTNNGTITTTQYIGPAGDVFIPDTINGLPVTTVGNRTFWCNSGVTSVTIPNSVTSIGDDVFFFCTSMTNFTIGTGLTNMGIAPFSGCSSLTTIAVDVSNQSYSSINGILFDRSQTAIIYYPPGKSGGYSIPSGVTAIGTGAFFFCSSLTSITIPNTVITIGYNAFIGCGLTAITIPNSVTDIGSSAFSSCSLTSVTLGTNVTNIGSSAFYGSPGLTTVTIPNSVTSIGDGAFSHCSSLVNLTIGSGVTSIGNLAFSYCSSLPNITIGSGVTNIGQTAFSACGNLRSITVNASNQFYSSVDGVWFDKRQSTLLQYPMAKADRYYTVPNGVTTIWDNAFGAVVEIASPQNTICCAPLVAVTIPASVTLLGDIAFYGCTNLIAVYFLGNAPFPYRTAMKAGGTFTHDPATFFCLPGAGGYLSYYKPLVVLVSPPRLSGLNRRPYWCEFTINGYSNQVVVVEACTNLVNPVWLRIGYSMTPRLFDVTLTSGHATFYDDYAEGGGRPAARFYRVRQWP